MTEIELTDLITRVREYDGSPDRGLWVALDGTALDREDIAERGIRRRLGLPVDRGGSAGGGWTSGTFAVLASSGDPDLVRLTRHVLDEAARLGPIRPAPNPRQAEIDAEWAEFRRASGQTAPGF
jgi:hypothetical protein